MIGLGRVSILTLRIEQILRITDTFATVDEWKGWVILASENKKRKAKNSYLYNGGDRLDFKMKRIAYYTKRDRNRLKKIKPGE